MNSKNEQLLTQLLRVIDEKCEGYDLSEIQAEISNVLSDYVVTLDTRKDSNDINEKIEIFLAAKKLEGLSSLSLKDYDLELNIFKKHVQKKAEEINTADIRLYLSKFPDLKPSSIAKKLSTLKSFFGWLASEEIISKDPTVKLKPPKFEKGRPKFLSVEELETLRESCINNRERSLIEVMYSTGCRLSELQQLNREDVSFEENNVIVYGKGGKTREVYFSFKAVYYLKKYLDERSDNETPLLVTERRPYRRLSNRGIQKLVNKIAVRAGIKKTVSPHSLRHTFATLTLNNGADISSVQALLGHTSPATTQIYARVSDERKREQHKKYLVL